MSLVDRVKNILMTPKPEWQRIDAEPATPASLFGGYAAILAGLSAIGTFIGTLIIIVALASLLTAIFGAAAGTIFAGTALGIGGTLVHTIVMFFVGLAIVYAMGMITAALAPSFAGSNNQISGLKVAVYASTANWVGGIISIVPIIGGLIGFLLLFYSIYLFYLGSIAVQKVPQDKAVGFTAVIAVIWLVISMVVGWIVSAIVNGIF